MFKLFALLCALVAIPALGQSTPHLAGVGAMTGSVAVSSPMSDGATGARSGGAYTLAYSTFLGGGQVDEVRQIKPQTDGDGGYWVFGVTKGSIPFVDNGGGFDATANGGLWDLWLAKIDASLTTIECATYLGTPGEDRNAYGLHVFGNNEPLLTGFTDGPGFPTTPGAFDTSYNGGDDAFLTRFASDCSAPVWSTFYGGTGLETPRGGFAVDGTDTIYMVGETSSNDLPGVAGHYDASPNGSSDGYVAVWSPSGNLLRATYVGGSGFDMISGVVLRGNTLYFEGWTNSTNLPVTGNAAVTSQPGDDSQLAGWMPKSLGSMSYLTYRGGSSYEYGEVYPTLSADGTRFHTSGPTGSDASTYLPTPNGYDVTHNGGDDCVVTAWDTATGDAIWTTYLGGSAGDTCERPTVDTNGNVLVFGSTYSTDFPTTTGAFDETHNGDRDVFFSVLSPDGQTLLYSTYIGGGGDDRTRGGYVFGDEIWITGRANNGFPTTPGAYDTTHGGNSDAYILKLVPAVQDAPPGAPAALLAVPGDGQIGLSWSQASDGDLAATLVERSLTSGSGFTQVQAVAAGSEAWMDTGLENGTTYYYRARSEDAGGNLSPYSNEVNATPGFVTDADDGIGAQMQARVQAYPNPFGRRTEVSYSVPQGAHVELVVYDIAGREIERLVDRFVERGEYRAVWDAAGHPGGTYLCRLVIGGEEMRTAQVVLVR